MCRVCSKIKTSYANIAGLCGSFFGQNMQQMFEFCTKENTHHDGHSWTYRKPIKCHKTMRRGFGQDLLQGLYYCPDHADCVSENNEFANWRQSCDNIPHIDTTIAVLRHYSDTFIKKFQSRDVSTSIHATVLGFNGEKYKYLIRYYAKNELKMNHFQWKRLQHSRKCHWLNKPLNAAKNKCRSKKSTKNWGRFVRDAIDCA